MKRRTLGCGCEQGRDCFKTTMCAVDSALQDQAEEYDRRIETLIDKWSDEIFSYRHPVSFALELKEVMEINE